MSVDSPTFDEPSLFPPQHLDYATLEARIRALSPSTDEARVERVVVRLSNNRRRMPGRVRLDVDAGVVGDRWIDGRNPKRHSQVTLMRYDVARVMTGGNEVAILGDNLFASIDTSAENLPPGSLLRVGTALCEVTHKPHEGCSKFAARLGEDAWNLTLSDDFKVTQLRGVHLSVVESGEVGEGDTISLLRRV